MKKYLMTLVLFIFVVSVFAQNNRVALKTNLIEFKAATREQKQKYIDSLKTIYPFAEKRHIERRYEYVDSVRILYLVKESRSFVGEAKSLSDAIRVFDKTAKETDKEIITSMNEYYFLSFFSGENGQLIMKYAYQDAPGKIILRMQNYVNFNPILTQFEAFEKGKRLKTLQKYYNIKVIPWCQDFSVEKNGEIILRAKHENGTFIFCEGTKVSEWLMPSEL